MFVCVYAAVDKAYKMLLEPDHKKKALDVIHAGKEYVEHMVRQTSHSFCFEWVYYRTHVTFDCSDDPEEETVEEGRKAHRRGGGRP